MQIRSIEGVSELVILLNFVKKGHDVQSLIHISSWRTRSMWVVAEKIFKLSFDG